jgi:hypothetical protein
MLEVSAEALLKAVVKALGVDKLRMFMENDWYLLGSVFYAVSNVPVEAYKNMSREEIERAESLRHNMAKTVLPLLAFARNTAMLFPSELVEKKVTAEWLLEKAKERIPELAKAVEAEGERGKRWLERQAKELVDYLTGRTCYLPGVGMVPVGLVKKLQEAAKHAK